MGFTVTLICTLFIFVVQIKARSLYLDSSWGDSDTYGSGENWETSNTLARPELLDFNRRIAAKTTQANWFMDIFRELYSYIPKPIIRPGIYGRERATNEYNQTTRPFTARVPIEYLGHWPYDFL